MQAGDTSSISQKAVRDILSLCYRRALFTRTHAQIELQAMYASLNDCREKVQRKVPLIASPDLQQAATDIVGQLDTIKRQQTTNENNFDEIDKAKRRILEKLVVLARGIGVPFSVPRALEEDIYHKLEEANEPPRRGNLFINEKIADTPPTTQASLESDTASRPQVNTPEWPRKQPFQPHILIMKGGGVKGIAYVGALKVLEAYGYKFQHFVGTSAGAITAALLSVGYTSTELGDVLAKTNFREFKDGWLPLSLLLLPFRKGLYKGESFRVWLEELLRKKFPRYANTLNIKFSHLSEIDPDRRLTIFTSIKGRRAHPFDSGGPEKCPNERIAFACRCSMAIPYFFIPEKIGGERVVDGGMQNNYPVNALLASDQALKDTGNFLGLYLGHKTVQRSGKWLFLDLFSIWGESGDEEAKEKFVDRTIVIDPRPIKTTDFSLTSKEVQFLLAEGRASALHWLHYWADSKPEHLPTLNEVQEAASASAELRTAVIAERWRRLWPKLAASTLLLIIALTGVIMKARSEEDINGPYPTPTPISTPTSTPSPCDGSKESGNIYERKETSGDKSLDDKVRLIYISTKQIFQLDNTDHRFYCGASAFAIPNRDGNCTVTLGIDLMNKLNDSTPAGEARIYFVVAQEMAHCMQIKKEFNIAGRQLEREAFGKIIDLHADFLAGWAAARFLEFGGHNQLELEQAFSQVMSFASDVGDVGGRRGTPLERQDAARAGYGIKNESDPERAYQQGGEYLIRKYNFINNPPQ